MAEYTLKIDPATRDFVFDEDGMLEIVEGDDVYVQNVDCTLKSWKSEFFLDESHGTDYDRVLSQDYCDILRGEGEEIVREGILQESHVSLIETLEVAIRNRTVYATFAAELASGEEFESEVTQSG